MKLLLVLVSTILLSSCASLFNPEHCRTDFRSPVPRTVLIDSTTIQVQPGKATPVAFMRGNQTKEAVLITDTRTDTRTDTIEVRPRWSEAYYLNFATCGVGFLFDGKTPKKWKYPSTLRLTDRYIDRHRKGADPYADYRYADKGSWNLHISLPYDNAFYSAYGKENQWGAGFLGLSLGLSYHTSDKTFVNLSAAGILDSEIPIPAAIDYESPQVKDHRYSILANLSNNHLLLQKRLSLGYGLSYGYDTWNTIHHGIAQEGEKTGKHPSHLAFPGICLSRVLLHPAQLLSGSGLSSHARAVRARDAFQVPAHPQFRLRMAHPADQIKRSGLPYRRRLNRYPDKTIKRLTTPKKIPTRRQVITFFNRIASGRDKPTTAIIKAMAVPKGIPLATSTCTIGTIPAALAYNRTAQRTDSGTAHTFSEDMYRSKNPSGTKPCIPAPTPIPIRT